MSAPNITIPQEAWMALQDYLWLNFHFRLMDQSAILACRYMLRNWPGAMTARDVPDEHLYMLLPLKDMEKTE